MSSSPRVPQTSPSPLSHTHSLGLESSKVGIDRPGGPKLSSDDDESQYRAKIAHWFENQDNDIWGQKGQQTATDLEKTTEHNFPIQEKW